MNKPLTPEEIEAEEDRPLTPEERAERDKMPGVGTDIFKYAIDQDGILADVLLDTPDDPPEEEESDPPAAS